MARITADEVRTALASVLKMEEDALPSSWDDKCARAATYANGAIIGALMSRGFRLDEEVLLFDRYAEFAADLGVWKALMLGGGYGSFDVRTLGALDRHEELKTVYVFVDDEFIKPASGQPGTTTTGGPLAQDSSAVFNWDASDRVNRGIDW